VILLLLDGLALGCIYALIALGYTMVYGIIKLINFAHGEFYMMGAYAGFFVLEALRQRGLFTPGEAGPGAIAAVFILTMVVAALAAGVLAVVVERLAYRPLRRAGRIAALLAALGVSLLLQNVALKVFTPDTRYFNPGIEDRRYPRTSLAADDIATGAEFTRDVFYLDPDGEEHWLAGPGAPLNEARLNIARERGAVAYHTYPRITVRKKQIIIWASVLAMTFALHLLVQYTRIGKAMRAVSHDLDAAQLMGINVNLVIGFTFFIGALMAGAGGVLVASYYGTIKPGMGVMYGLKAFVAAVLGGIGSIYGAVLGGLTLGLAESLVKLSPATAPYQDAFAFAVLVVILVFMPYGFMGRRKREKV
jgi:branched-chain amino acid transport system permease protein